MTVTAATILVHELIGLDVQIVEAANDDLVGLAGRVVDETTNTLRIEGTDGRTRTAPKAGATFEFALEEGPVVVDGARLVARPARRTQQMTGGTTWHSA